MDHLTAALAGADTRLSPDVLDRIDEIVAPGAEINPADNYITIPAATRARIVAAAAALVLERGVGGTTLDDIRAGTSTSKSQLFHYFPSGKIELVAAIAAYQSERVLQAQQPFLDGLDTWGAWDGWREAVVRHYGSQPHWGCPIGSLVNEVLAEEPQLGKAVASRLEQWRGYLEAGLTRMQANGLLPGHASPRTLSIAIFAALQGGLLLTQTSHSVEPLEAALDMALIALHASADSPTRRQVDG
jgi:AcrR family transcriptional regulator